MKREYLSFIKDKIKIFYTVNDKEYVKETYFGVKKGIGIVSSYFGLNKKLPAIKVIIAKNRLEYNSFLQHLFKLESSETPLTRIAQVKGNYMLLLSPQSYATDSVYVYNRADYFRLLIHEIIHMVVRIVAGGDDNVPRWFEEGLAVYLSKQWLYEDEFKKPIFQKISINRVPSLAKIIRIRRYYYYWGWTIIKYIEKKYGKKMISEITKKCAQRDIFKILNEKKHLFEQKWKRDLLNNTKEYVLLKKQ
ncbi:MAG: hypothetical protein ACPL28_08355 [bacterium]